MLENDYYYELKYVYNDKVVTVKFNGEKNFNEVVENIQDFLKSAGWQEDTVKEHIKTNEDIEEDNCKCDDIKKEDETYYQEYNCPDNNYEFKNNINYYDHNYKYDINNDYYQYDGNEPYHGYTFNDDKE